MRKYAIIVAGGKGLRMGGDTPKQFLLLRDKPVIVHTIQQFLTYEPNMTMIVVLPKDHIDTWETIRTVYFPKESIRCATGGDQRFDSVKAGLHLLDGDGLVAIHDAVRPFVSIETIRDAYKSADLYGSGVASIILKDSIREIKKGKSKARNRANFRLVQTPQTFRLDEIKDAYRVAEHSQFTDDASVFEEAGYEVHLVDGSNANIKITTPEDLK